MNRKDPDKKGKSTGLYLTAEAAKILAKQPNKGRFASIAIIKLANECQHDWGLQKLTGTELFEGVCTKCGVKLSEQVNIAYKTL